LTVFEHRRIGLEQEFFLVDERGILSNRADEFLDECRETAHAAGRDPRCFAPECARSMVWQIALLELWLQAQWA
jgi:gamma-glutamyl:cysteine ligase YbdK (ATP-grasp superfamily)